MKMKHRGSNLPASDFLKQKGASTPKTTSQTELEKMRISVFLAHSGIASRRTSETFVTEGRVTVNGEVVTNLATKVTSSDIVTFDGNPVSLEEKNRYILLNKPDGVVCSLSDEKGRPTAADILKESVAERVYNVGRLDMYSKGLIIFTNDGDFARLLSHPSSELEKEYVVNASQDIPDELVEKFKRGIRVEGVFYKARDCWKSDDRKLHVILLEGKNREIRNVFKFFEIPIRSLIRVRIGQVQIAGMAPGTFRDLTEKEVADLKKECAQKL